MRRGIIVEKNKKYVTLLTPDGQFLKTKYEQQDYKIGQEVAFPNETRMGRKRAGFFDLLRLRPLKAGILSIAAIIVVIFTIMPSFSDHKAYAYMTIDINPSFELKLDHRYQVIGVTPLNEDAKKVLASIKDWKKSDVTNVVHEIIEDCDQKGYIKSSKNILISTVYENKQDHTYKTEVKSKLDNISVEYKERNYDLETVESDLETREKAQKEGMSTGTYLRNKQSHEKEDIMQDEETVNDDALTEEKSDQDENKEDRVDGEDQKEEKTSEPQTDQDKELPESKNGEKEQKELTKEEPQSKQKITDSDQTKPKGETKESKKGDDQKDKSPYSAPGKEKVDKAREHAEKQAKKNDSDLKRQDERQKKHGYKKESPKRSDRSNHSYEK
ncbi:anti-sigma-I factor RsgI family protein [Bacillus sp. NPDC077027]|uniref:anti-sigma factor domain-containing protein n=1 Tax=Bacillus sp. NPDC077027 TaxID=3390548 RepID=UPI003D00CCD2